jgi:predicted transglutaminase-like cysteine proteinase
MKQAIEKTRQWPWAGKFLARTLLKTLIFGMLAAVILNPNLRLAVKQIHHTLYPESLLQSNFPSCRVINERIDGLVADDAGRQPEIKLIEKFVCRNIRYVSDYENWSNAEYWPTAEEAWSRGREDCDGRAVLAVSILRSRGYRSAKLVVGLQHMWVTVNANEKEQSKPAAIVALLNPETKLSLELRPKPGASHFVRLAKAFVQPTALRETGAGIIADIPPLRKAILVLVLLLVWHLPLNRLRLRTEPHGG